MLSAAFTFPFEFIIDDRGINYRDLAFFLVTHNYDARAAGNHVGVKLNGEVYLLISLKFSMNMLT